MNLVNRSDRSKTIISNEIWHHGNQTKDYCDMAKVSSGDAVTNGKEIPKRFIGCNSLVHESTFEMTGCHGGTATPSGAFVNHEYLRSAGPWV
jgi:hypothetical protein